MVKKVVTKKVSAKEIVEKDSKVAEDKTEVNSELEGVKTKKKCLFCQSKTTPSYTDIVTLRRFLTDRGMITPKLRSGVCSRHQRAVTKNIKYARHLSLLSFTPKA